MGLKDNLIYNSLELPWYWWQTKRVRNKVIEAWHVEKLSYGPDAKQYALIIEPEKAEASTATTWALYFHGGAWTFGSPEQFIPAARLFLEAGMRVVMPSYRRLPLHNFGHLQADLTQLLLHLAQDRKQRFSADTPLLAGMSAGGHLAATLAWCDEFWEDHWKETPRSAVLCGAVMDLDLMPFGPGLRLLRGSKGGPIFDRANPMYWLHKKEAIATYRYLLIHGNMDGMAPIGQARKVAQILAEKGSQVAFQHLEGGTHLDACRWMYQEDEPAQKIRKFIKEYIEFQSTPSEYG